MTNQAPVSQSTSFNLQKKACTNKNPPHTNTRQTRPVDKEETRQNAREAIVAPAQTHTSRCAPRAYNTPPCRARSFFSSARACDVAEISFGIGNYSNPTISGALSSEWEREVEARISRSPQRDSSHNDARGCKGLWGGGGEGVARKEKGHKRPGGSCLTTPLIGTNYVL